tara:strand:+ start:270 stop:473 length:204 start_codon:yes stop_codon:yes gene_type:complete
MRTQSLNVFSVFSYLLFLNIENYSQMKISKYYQNITSKSLLNILKREGFGGVLAKLYEYDTKNWFKK